MRSSIPDFRQLRPLLLLRPIVNAFQQHEIFGSQQRLINKTIMEFPMPVIRIDYDDAKVEKDDVTTLSNAIQKIVSDATHIEDVFVYANSSQIKIKIAPIEIFIQMSAHKIKDEDALVNEIKLKLSDWKKKNSFKHSINMTFIPMNWKIEIGI